MPSILSILGLEKEEEKAPIRELIQISKTWGSCLDCHNNQTIEETSKFSFLRPVTQKQSPRYVQINYNFFLYQ